MMPTMTSVRAAELWAPDPDGYLLEFADGLYGDAFEFDAVSRQLVFGRGEGLPGRAWEEGRPQWIASLEGSYFRRIRQARDAGFVSAVGIPYFADGKLDAVAVLFFGTASPDVVTLDAATENGADAIDLRCADLAGVMHPVRLRGTAARPIARRVVRRQRVDGDTDRPRLVHPAAGGGAIGQIILPLASTGEPEFVVIDP